MQEQNPVRGYFSSVDQQLLFGLGKYDHIDSLVAIWPDNKKQVIKNIAADTIIDSFLEKCRNDYMLSRQNCTKIIFSDITSASGILYKHHDNSIQ